MRYRFELRGGADEGQVWSCSGYVERAENFRKVFDEVLRRGFMELTEGRAVYGMPGKGCRGPYTVTHLLITGEPQ